MDCLKCLRMEDLNQNFNCEIEKMYSLPIEYRDIGGELRYSLTCSAC